MIINKNLENKKLTVFVEGRLDTMTSPELEQFILDNIYDAEEMVLDLNKLEYISSAGLRVVLMTHKKMVTKGGLTVVGANENIKEVFEITGFDEILNLA